MGLRLNHISASFEGPDGLLDGRNRGAIGVSGSMYFETVAHLGSSAATDAKAGFPGHKDAAYIFSGSATGDGSGLDKTVFLGDVVVSGSFASAAGSFVDAVAGAAITEIAVFTNADTIEGDPDFTFDKSTHAFQIGNASGEGGALSFANDDLRLFHDGNDDVGITTGDLKFSITGSKTAGTGVTGLEIGSDAGVILGQGGGSDANKASGFITVRAIAATADVNDGTTIPGTDAGNAALMVKADAGGLLLSGSKSTKLYGRTGLVVDSSNTVDIDGGGAVSINSAAAINVGNDDVDQALNLGTDGERAIGIGTMSGTGGAPSTSVTVGAVAVDIDGGATGVTIDALDAGAINIGTSTVATSDTSAINIGTSATARTITVGNDASTLVDLNALGIELDAGSTGINVNSSKTGVNSIVVDSSGGLVLRGSANSNLTARRADLSVTATGTDASPGRVLLSGSSGADSVLVQSPATFSEDVVMAGSLTVQGGTTSVSTTNLIVEDALIGLQSELDGVANTNDIGFIFERGTSGDNGVFVWDESEDRFILGTTTATPDASGFLTIASGSLAADIVGTSTKVTVTDNTSTTAFPVVFHNEANGLLDSQHVEIIPGDGSSSFAKLQLIGGDAADKAEIGVDANAALTIQTTDDAGANGHINVAADGDIVLNNASGDFKFQMTGSALATLSNATAGVELDIPAGEFHLDVPKVIKLDSNIFDFSFAEGATERLVIETDGSDHVQFTGDVSNKDLIFAVNNGGAQGTEVVRVVAATPGLTMKDATPVNLGDTTAFLKRGGAAGKVSLGAGANAADAILIQASHASGGIDLEAGTHIDVTSATGKITLAADNGSGGGNTDDDAIKLDASVGGIEALAAKSINLISEENQADSIVLYAKHDSGGIDFKIGDASSTTVMMSMEQAAITVGAAVLPSSDNGLDLGATGLRFRNIFTGDLNLRNDRGDWTLIEEEDFISFRNNLTGRRFRMVMEDITGTGTYGPGNDGEM